MDEQSARVFSSPEEAPRVVLITGPTSGLGRAIALELAKRGMQLALLGRNPTKLAEIVTMCEELGAPTPRTLVCDMSSQPEVRRTAEEFLAMGLPLHVLINNAGAIHQHRRLTVDGLEETTAVGYFSAFLLTMCLAEKLAASSPSMVINTTSDTYPMGRLDLDDLRFDESYGPIRSYASSKLATVIFTRMLAERLSGHGVQVNVYNPGMNYTNLAVGNNSGLAVTLGGYFFKYFSAPIEQGIEVPVALASDPAFAATTGQLFMRGKPKPMNAMARDPQLGSALWEVSEIVTGATLPGSLASPRSADGSAPIRMGVLGAARIAPFSLFQHARRMSSVEVTAVAEEHQPVERTIAYARKHDIPTIYRRFEKLLGDREIDAIYLALPISLHEQLALRCIAAGKHLLCEKPLAANAEQARRIDAARRESDLIVFEAMHSLQHPLVERLRAILESGEIGAITQVQAGMSAYIPKKDFRFEYELGGGCTIDMGCYPIAFLRAVLGTEPTVVGAKASLVAPNVDGSMEASLAFPNAPDVHLFVGMRSLRRPLDVSMRFAGTHGRIDLLNYIKPEVYHRLVVRSRGGRRVERVPGASTYGAQLAAFVDAIRGGGPVKTTTGNAIGTMTVVDAIYEKAGLPHRGLP